MTGDVSHPPLARVMGALGPWLAGEHWTPTGNTTTDGTSVLGYDAHYDRMLALARLGMLPFFLLACVMVFLWGNRTGGPVAGLMATFLFTTIPPVLAHATLVTTDMAATAFTVTGAYIWLLWAERPDWRRTACWARRWDWGCSPSIRCWCFCRRSGPRCTCASGAELRRRRSRCASTGVRRWRRRRLRAW